VGRFGSDFLDSFCFVFLIREKNEVGSGAKPLVPCPSLYLISPISLFLINAQHLQSALARKTASVGMLTQVSPELAEGLIREKWKRAGAKPCFTQNFFLC
jgi:hypothetical protein